MKSWFDLTKQEQISLKNEFNSKKRVLDLSKFLYVLSILWFFIFLFWIIMSLTDFIENATRNAICFGTIFGICILLAIINSLMVSEHEKEFKTWLKTRNIEK